MSYPIRLLAWMSPRHASHGLPVWTPLIQKEQRPLIYTRLDEALNLLAVHTPGRYERARHSLKGFLIFGIEASNASYDPATEVCRLGERFMLAPETTAAAIACAIVHEATHGRLAKLGIPYDEPIRYRVEMVCIKSSLLAARSLPGGDAEVERCRRQLSIDPGFFSHEKYTERKVQTLRELGAPEWAVRTFIWIRRKRTPKVSFKNPPKGPIQL